MEIRIRTDEGDDGEESLLSLYRWLHEDMSLERTAEVELREAPTEEGAMGGAWDTVDVVLTHATALSGLALAVATWRSTRPSAPPLTVERGGVTVTVHSDDPDEVRRLLEALAPDGADSPPEG
ncbi:hypothetical protein [Streptomyces sp. NPDC048636]|uniref:effector-associated constant component EACC1 n=1 Tax=Streptomyces sp. NPDC048636 TaxID=3155762 RepID=UPI00344AC8F3